MFKLFRSGISEKDKERKRLIIRYKNSLTAIDRFHINSAQKALSFAKVAHGDVKFIISPLSSNIMAYAPETKIFLGGYTSRELIRYSEFVDVDDPMMSLEDLKIATRRSENSLDSVIRKVCSSPYFSDKHHEMLKNDFVWDQVPLSWVSSISVRKNRKLVAHAAPGAIKELTGLPSKVYEILRNGGSLSGDFASMEIDISYAIESTQSLHETSRISFIYHDVPASRSAKNQQYIESVAAPILPLLRSLTTAMRECQYENYILASSAHWMKDPEPKPCSFDLDDEIP
jgi:hypothetical protein